MQMLAELEWAQEEQKKLQRWRSWVQSPQKGEDANKNCIQKVNRKRWVLKEAAFLPPATQCFWSLDDVPPEFSRVEMLPAACLAHCIFARSVRCARNPDPWTQATLKKGLNLMRGLWRKRGDGWRNQRMVGFKYLSEVEQPKSGHAQPDSPWSSEASAEAKASGCSHLAVQSPQECSLEQLTEWAQKEKLGSRFLSHLEELIKQGGLRKVTDKVLRDLGIMLPALRKKILVAIKRKLVGNQKVRFGEILKFDPILTKIPNRGCPWLNIDAIEVRHDRDTWQAAIRTWRFCSTGMDGLEEISLLRDVFDAWKATPKARSCGEDFGVKCFQETQWPMLMRGSVQSWRDLCAVVGWGGA
eukprot:s765_g9.t1